MRTTVVLDPDVARLLEKEAHRQDKPLAQVANELIRRGLLFRTGDRPTPHYRVRPHKTTLRPGVLGSFNKLADEIEDEVIVKQVRGTRRARR